MGCFQILLIFILISILIACWPILLVVIIIYFLYKYYSHKNKISIHSYNFNGSEVDYDLLDGHEFEYFCADVLKKNGYQNVSVTKGSGDNGIDIVARKNNKKYAIQCKCYSSNIGNKAVQEAFTGKTFYNADIAVVLTNRYFTRSAIETARKTSVLLWDRKYLNNMIKIAGKTPVQDTQVDQNDQDSDIFSNHKQRKNTKHFSPTIITSKNVPNTKSFSSLENNTEERDTMYDKEKGIYPSGHYLVGRDIPLGGYILTARTGKSGCVALYPSYAKFKKEEDEIMYVTFEEDFHISLMEENTFLEVENADIQKIQ